MKTKKSYSLKLLDKAAFDKLTLHEKRVTLANDVLLRIRLRKIRPLMGNIISLDFRNKTIGVGASETQRLVNKKKCEGCAKGALLFAWIGNFDSFGGTAFGRIDNHSLSWGFPDELKEVFGKRLLSAIEVAFEKSFFSWSQLDSLVGEMVNETNALRKAFPIRNVSRRMTAIFKNIVKNNGRLVVPWEGGEIVFD